MGISNGKVVVVCKDFLNNDEVFYDYQEIKNTFNLIIEEKRDNLSSSLSGNFSNLEELELLARENYYFQKIPKLKEHFWNMFIIDALIDNNDRNNGNWGIILNKKNSSYRIAPVFDNGASFYNKLDNNKLESLLENDEKFKQIAYDSVRTFFRISDKSINPLKYIESLENENCNKAFLEIFPKINLEKIENIINEIPNDYKGINIISKYQKELYIKVIKYRYENVFKPTYEKLIGTKK